MLKRLSAQCFFRSVFSDRSDEPWQATTFHVADVIFTRRNGRRSARSTTACADEVCASPAGVATQLCEGLQQAEFAQLAAHRLGHGLDARSGLAEIGGSVLIGQVAPALKWAQRPRRHRHRLWF